MHIPRFVRPRELVSLVATEQIDLAPPCIEAVTNDVGQEQRPCVGVALSKRGQVVEPGASRKEDHGEARQLSIRAESPDLMRDGFDEENSLEECPRILSPQKCGTCRPLPRLSLDRHHLGE